MVRGKELVALHEVARDLSGAGGLVHVEGDMLLFGFILLVGRLLSCVVRVQGGEGEVLVERQLLAGLVQRDLLLSTQLLVPVESLIHVRVPVLVVVQRADGGQWVRADPYLCCTRRAAMKHTKMDSPFRRMCWCRPS